MKILLTTIGAVLWFIISVSPVHAQIGHDSIDWEAVDSAFYAQYDPEIPPKWLFPIIFEEGRGMRDTIYLGYHEEKFWDTIETFDTSYFNVHIGRGHWEDNETRKVIVQTDHGRDIFTLGSPNFHKGQYPLYMYWDVERLDDPVLPFEDQSPAPRAEGFVEAYFDPKNLDEEFAGACEMVSDGALITDTVVFEYTCHAPHGFIFDDWIGFLEPDKLHNMRVRIRPWKGGALSSNELTSNPVQGMNLDVYPNPASREIKLNMGNRSHSHFQIISPLGEIVKEDQTLNRESINIANLSPGQYFVLVLDEKGNLISREILIVNP